MALAQEKFAVAIDYVYALLDPTQQPPPEELEMVLEAALQAWKINQQDKATNLLQQAASLATQMSYL